MLKPFRQAPFLRMVLFYILGIIIQYRTDISFSYPYLLCLSLMLIALSFYSRLNKQYGLRWMFGAGIALLSIVTGAAWLQKGWERSDWVITAQPHNYLLFVLDDPTDKPKTRMCKVEILSSDSLINKSVTGKKAIIYLPKNNKSADVLAGDCLWVNALLEKPLVSPNSSFDYPLYLRKQSNAAIGFVKEDHWHRVELPSISWSKKLNIKAISMRRLLLQKLKQILPDEDNYSVAAALMFGYKNSLDKDLRQRFANTGAGHVLAISGLHFNIIFGILFLLFYPLKVGSKRRLLRLLIVLPLIWAFAFITGFSPSISRAAWMMTVWLIGDTFFFRSFTMNTVSIAAFFMLLYNPLYLFDVGFQLSFSAVIAIVLLYPYLSNLLHPTNRILWYFWSLSVVSTSAQIGVMPLSMYYFHQIPLLFLITNILILPLLNIILFLIPLDMLLSTAFQVQTIPLNECLNLFINIITTLNNIPRGTLSNVFIDEFQTLLLYLSLGVSTLLLIRKRIVWFYLLLILAIIYVLYYLC